MKVLRITGLIFAITVILVLSMSCGEGQDYKNVLLIPADTLRADHLGCYGYDKIGTPRIARKKRA